MYHIRNVFYAVRIYIVSYTPLHKYILFFFLPYSCEGNAKIANSSGEYCFPNFSNNAYPFAVNPHCDATFCANTTFPSKSDVDKVDPSDLIPVNEQNDAIDSDDERDAALVLGSELNAPLVFNVKSDNAKKLLFIFIWWTIMLCRIRLFLEWL